MIPDVNAFHHAPSDAITYVVSVPEGKHCAVIDPVLDFVPGTGRTDTEAAEAVVAFVRARDLTADWILETDLHEDHISAAPYLKAQIGGRIATGRGIHQAADHYARIFPAEVESLRREHGFDHLFADGERFHIGALPADALLTPGHSPAGVSYGVGDAIFVGDALLMPDCGTGRADLPGSDAQRLYQSARRILALPGSVRVYPGHDVRSGADTCLRETTVFAERRDNILLKGNAAESSFVEGRRAADAALDPPQLLLAAVQVNLLAGHLPVPDKSGVRSLKLPLNAL